MKNYPTSAIRDIDELFERIERIHRDCYFLCKNSFNRYFPNSGNMAVFTHFHDEYEMLLKVREQLTKPSNTPNQKYFELIKPITYSNKEDLIEVKYTHLYIRKPDPTPYGNFTGDVDFILPVEEYKNIKDKLINGEEIKGAKIYDRPDWDMIQLTDDWADAVAYVSTKEMAERARVRQAT